MPEIAEKPATQLALVGQAMTEFDKVAAGIAALEVKYKDVVYPVTTTKGMDEAKAARKEIRDARYAVQNSAKAAKSELTAISKNIGEKAEQIIAPLAALEEPIDGQIKAEEARKEAEKEAKRLAEIARVERIAKDIAGIRERAIVPAGATSEQIITMIGALAQVEITAEKFDEFLPAAQRAAEEVAATLANQLDAAVARGKEAERLAAERAELERQRKEQAAIAAAEKAERDRLAAIAAEEQRKAAEVLAAQQREFEAQRAAFEAQQRAFAEQQEAARREAEEEAVRARLLAAVFTPPLIKIAEPDLVAVDAEVRAKAVAAQEEDLPMPAAVADAVQDALNVRPEDEELRDAIAAHFDVSPEVADGWLRTYGAVA